MVTLVWVSEGKRSNVQNVTDLTGVSGEGAIIVRGLHISRLENGNNRTVHAFFSPPRGRQEGPDCLNFPPPLSDQD